MRSLPPGARSPSTEQVSCTTQAAVMNQSPPASRSPCGRRWRRRVRPPLVRAKWLHLSPMGYVHNVHYPRRHKLLPRQPAAEISRAEPLPRLSPNRPGAAHPWSGPMLGRLSGLRLAPSQRQPQRQWRSKCGAKSARCPHKKSSPYKATVRVATVSGMGCKLMSTHIRPTSQQVGQPMWPLLQTADWQSIQRGRRPVRLFWRRCERRLQPRRGLPSAHRKHVLQRRRLRRRHLSQNQHQHRQQHQRQHRYQYQRQHR